MFVRSGLIIVLLLSIAGCIRSYDEKDLEEAGKAIRDGDQQKLASLLDAHHDLANAVGEDHGSDGRTTAPLIMAAEAGNTQAVRLLLDHGANPNLRDTDDKVPLYAAVQADHLETARVLLERGANVSLRPDAASHRGSARSPGGGEKLD